MVLGFFWQVGATITLSNTLPAQFPVLFEQLAVDACVYVHNAMTESVRNALPFPLVPKRFNKRC
jgi:hypothetical protein